MLTMNAIFPNHISREMGNCVFSNISNLEYTVKYCLFSDALKGAFVYGFEVPWVCVKLMCLCFPKDPGNFDKIKSKSLIAKCWMNFQDEIRSTTYFCS